MREILFRGKRADNGEWVEGNLFIPDCPDKPTEICIGSNVVRITYEVVPTTIGQFTGLTDKNGTKIFEGDILEFTNGDDEKTPYLVVWDDFFSSWHIAQNGDRNFWDDFADFESERFEVIGNIHDNPELLEVSQ